MANNHTNMPSPNMIITRLFKMPFCKNNAMIDVKTSIGNVLGQVTPCTMPNGK
ncbi:MAG: hypothetical protein IPO37_03810 [Saprospiraceae bacterium]|nr:hypothetical protein [Saprospiraceae bacterium]